MNKWKLYNPRGMQDIQKAGCYNKRDAEEKLRKMYLSKGFSEIETPLVEYYDVFAAAGSETARQSPFKMVDEQGRILTLRPDMTIPASRVACTKLKEEDLPAKMFYFGKCFRRAEFNGGMMREFTQSGAEIIGSSNLFYDGLMIAAAADSMKSIGLDEFTIELGQVEFFKRLMELAGMSPEDNEKIRQLVDTKDFFGVEEMLIGRNIDESIKKLLLDLPNLYGKKEMLVEVRKMTSDVKLLAVLDQLSELLGILGEFKVLDYISVDLGMVSRLDYYTGIIFRGMTYGMGFPILGGGRYDSLCGRFGKDMPATGFSLGVDRALAALYRNKRDQDTAYAADSMVCFDSSDIKDAMMIAGALRNQGLRIEMLPMETDLEAIKKYSAAKGIDGLIIMEGGGKLKLMNLKDGSVEETDIKSLTGGVS